jgi:hypothetical protein
VAGDLFGEGRDQALAIDGDAKEGMDAGEQFGDMERGAGFLKYVIGHINLRPTFLGREGSGTGVALAKAADGAELSIERCFKYGEDGIFEIVVHEGLLSMGLRAGCHIEVGLSI